jgi:integrase
MVEDLIETFFTKKLITTYNTKKSYRGNINKFFRLLEKDINTYFDKNKTLEEYEDDLSKIYMMMEKNNVPLLTRKTFFNSVKQFQWTMDKRLKQLDFWDTLKTRTRGADPITEKFVPNAIDLKTVLSHGNTLSRAMYLIMTSTGCRIGELLALYPEDINTEIEPTIVTIRRIYDRKGKNNVKNLTKTKKQRICFLTSEATVAYNEWMKERDAYLKTTVKKSKYAKDPNDKRVFPMSDENAREIWSNLVKKSGLYKKDIETNRLTLHPHCIRSYFRSYFGNADLAEHLLGHATGMDKYYRNMKKEDLAKDFLKYAHNVTIFEREGNLTEVHEQLKEKDKQIQDLDEQLKDLRMELLEVKMKQVQELQRKK